jgi:mortality factor 4-like protein 1
MEYVNLLSYIAYCLYSEGFYRNENFSEGNYRNIVSRAAKDRKKSYPVKLPSEKKAKDLSDNDDLSSVFDHDLSTYDTLKNDEMSFEGMEDKGSDNKSFDPQDDEENELVKPEMLRKFNVNDKVYVRDKDGVLYLAVVRRHLYGPQFHKQVEMGLVHSIEEAQEKSQLEDETLTWHYFVHFDHWNVNFDRWVSEKDMFVISDQVAGAAKRISDEHRALQLEMRKARTKGKKSYQTVNGAMFLREWNIRLKKIHEELGFDQSKGMSVEDAHCVSDESEHSAKIPIKSFSWTKAALSTERKYRDQGLTSRDLSNGIVIPFTLKKILVQQWEYVNQCQMLPCVPAPITIRQVLKKYLESKNIMDSSPKFVDVSEGDDIMTSINSCRHEVDESAIDPIASDISAGKDIGREQEWRDMTDGIAMLFDESLESRLLYREELPQLHTIYSIQEYRVLPFSELYGCEHLLRLFIRLPEMLAGNVPDDEGRVIMAKLNDFIRFIHKNQTSLLTQTHRKLTELEKGEQQREERKRKETHNDDKAPHKNEVNINTS